MNYQMKLNEKEQAVLDQIKNKVDESVNEKTKLMQKQLDLLFEKTHAVPYTGKDSPQERKEAREWLVKFFKGQPVEQKLESGIDYMATAPDADGGYLVPELLQQEIAHYVLESGIARMRMRYMPFSGPGNTRRIPKELSGVSVQWIDEAARKPLTSVTFTEITQELKKLAAIAIITEELLEDAAFDLVGYVSRRIGEAIAREEDRVYFVGDILVGDPFDGIINATGVVPVIMNAGKGIADIHPDNLLAAIYAVPKEARSNAAFYVHSDVMFAIQQLKDDDNRYLVQQPMNGGEPPRLWGYPIYTVDVLPSLDEDEADLPFAVFANLQKTCVYGDKAGVRVKILTEATLTDGDNTIHLAQQDAVGVRVFKRTGYAVVHPEGIAVLTTGSAT
jgi:HK97 family phage major capsid protein